MSAAAIRYLVLSMLTVAVAAVVEVGASAGAWPSARVCAAGRSLYTVAHEDDSILFMNPDLDLAIHDGRCVRTVVVTAGDDGQGLSYALGRERGAMAAYAEMAGTADVWRGFSVRVNRCVIRGYKLVEDPRVSLLFMRLPDGDGSGGGFSADGYQSLQKLWAGPETAVTAIDGSATYTMYGLVTTLADEMRAFRPDFIGTQDFVGAFGDSDHSDHHAVAYLTRAAVKHYPRPYILESYEDYAINNSPVNLSPEATQEKEETWFAYAPYDTHVCQTVTVCEQVHVASFWQREYVLSSSRHS
jgi:LmbE family N-acetylglucosaminyl deacetylase